MTPEELKKEAKRLKKIYPEFSKEKIEEGIELTNSTLKKLERICKTDKEFFDFLMSSAMAMVDTLKLMKKEEIPDEQYYDPVMYLNIMGITFIKAHEKDLINIPVLSLKKL